ncbi:hypothetical protein OROGR_020799 [Orobanche gracilis]
MCSARFALQLSVQNSSGHQPNQKEVNKLFGDQSVMSSILASLPGVDQNDPHIKDLLASMQSQSENKEEDKTPPNEDEK